MKLSKLSKEELEAMSYSELAEAILTEKGKKLKIVEIFQKICKLLGMSDEEYENKVADFFELIIADKNFIVLDKGYCDLRKKHTPEFVVEEDDEEEVEEPEVEEEVTEEEPEEDDEDSIFYDNSSEEDDIDDGDDDDLSNFAIVEEDVEANI